jgi:hypothetical protein
MPQKTDETFVDFRFPLLGINTSMAYLKQPANTTPAAVNVRAFDGSTNKARGGSRCGLTPILGRGSTAQVSGFHLIQSLTCIVTASASAET